MRGLAIAIFAVSLLIGQRAVCQEITVVKFPGQPMAELLSALVEETGVSAATQVHPWPRIYQMALKQDNVLIGPFLRTDEREDRFKWLDVPIFSSRGYLYKLKHRKDIKVNTLEDARKYRIGKSREYALPKFLIENGFDGTLEPAITEEINFRKLLAQRVDLIVMYEKGIEAKLAQFGIAPDRVIPEYRLYALDTYLAFSRGTPDRIVRIFNEKLKQFERNGTLDKFRSGTGRN